MKRRRRVPLVLLGCGLLAVVAAFMFSSDDGPSHRGKSLGQWISIYRNGNDRLPLHRAIARNSRHISPLLVEAAEAEDAIRQIGTNALPCLLKWIRYERPEWKDKLEAKLTAFGDRFRKDENDSSPLDWLFPPGKPMFVARAELRVMDALVAFQILGPAGRMAIPELKRLMLDTNAPAASWKAVGAVAGLGEDALPALVEVLVDPQSPAGTRQEVAHWIRFLPSDGANATSHLPVLIRCLSDPDPFVADGAAIALGRIGVQPEICVPALVECLTNRIVGRAAIQALGLFGGKAQDALPALRGALNTRDPDIRAVAAKAIRDITATRPEAP